MNFSTTLKAAALAFALPMAAQAATISSTTANSDLEVLSAGETYTETWTTDGSTYSIPTISFTLNGSAASATTMPSVVVSVDGVDYSFSSSSWTIITFGSNAIGYLFAGDEETGYAFTTSSDFTITMDYTASVGENLLATYTFAASEVTLPAVPVPAAGWLMLGGIGALGAMRKLRKS